MYSTCFYCHHALGTNEVIEHFQVGRRLAFDGKRGRLWVVCTRCRRWSLTPIEERWDAIEECERHFRATPLRAFTEHIGLARVKEGLDLVRVGEALRPEFASWRYAGRLRARRLRSVAIGSIVGVAGGTVFAAGATVATAAVMLTGGVAAFPVVRAADHWLQRIEEYLYSERIVAHVRVTDGRVRPIRVKHLGRLEIVPRDTGDWILSVAHDRGSLMVEGAAATQTAGRLLARINESGASDSQVRGAVNRIADAGGPERFIVRAARLRHYRWRSGEAFSSLDYASLGLTPGELLSLEMAMNEDAERQALEGELAALEAAWRDAEEIAEISDNLLLPRAVQTWLQRRRPRES